MEEVAGFAAGAAVVEVDPAVVVAVPSGSAEGVAELVAELALCAVLDAAGAVVDVAGAVVEVDGGAVVEVEELTPLGDAPEDEPPWPRMVCAPWSARFMFLMSCSYVPRSPFFRSVCACW